jgi:hypothetical protein
MGQIPSPRKEPKTGIWGGRLITVESVSFYAAKASISFWPIKNNQELEQIQQYLTPRRNYGEAGGNIGKLDQLNRS